MIYIKNYINGALLEPKNNNFINVYNPSVGKVYASCPNSCKNDLNLAIDSAKKAFPDWSNLTSEHRSKYLFKIAALLKKELKEFSKSETLDNGKPITLSENLDIPRSIENLNFFGTLINNLESEIFPMERLGINYTLKQPLGIVGTISPWNLPLYLFTWKIAPALATGNCVIAKPSEITPLTAYMFSKICIKAKLPKGVLNILHGEGSKIGHESVKHPDIKAISFTGGTPTGKKIAKECSNTFKKLNLEMGGKNPVIIFDDCNYSEMMDSIVKSSFLNQGQICLAGSRIYIQKKIYNKFKKDFIERVEKIKVGDPFDQRSNQGAIVSEDHFNKIKHYIKIAKKENTKILIGGNKASVNGHCSNGWFFEPTIIENFDDNSVVNKDEIFGPVVTLNCFKSEQEVLKMANNSDYGLASIIWTEDMEKAQRIAGLIESGIVWINCWLERDLRTPFGGIKNSGYGKEGGKYALDFFTEQKNVCIKYYE